MHSVVEGGIACVIVAIEHLFRIRGFNHIIDVDDGLEEIALQSIKSFHVGQFSAVLRQARAVVSMSGCQSVGRIDEAFAGA